MTGPVEFADISDHQTNVHLGIYAGTHNVVVMKATRGDGSTDPYFADRWKLAGVLRLIRGAYHYAHTTSSAVAQADAFADALTAAGPARAGDLVILDVEDDTTLDAIATADEFASLFCERMLTRGYPEGILYTGRWYADPAGITPGDVPTGWRHLWLSDYTAATDAAMALPSGWDYAHVVARQFTNRATVPGIAGPVDYSRVLPPGVPLMADATIDQIRAVLAELITAHESRPDSTGHAPVANMADTVIRAFQPWFTGDLNQIYGPLKGGPLESWTLPNQLAAATAPLAAKLDALNARVVMTPVLTDADVDRIATAVITQLAAGITLTVTPAPGGALPGPAPATS